MRRFMVPTSSMFVPNLKRVALFVQKLLDGATFRNWVTVNPVLSVALYSMRRRGPYTIAVPNLKRIAQFVQNLLRGSQNFEIRSRDSKPRPF